VFQEFIKSAFRLCLYEKKNCGVTRWHYQSAKRKECWFSYCMWQPTITKRSTKKARITSKQTWKPENVWLSNHCVIAILPSQNQPSAAVSPIMPIILLFRNYVQRRDQIPGYEEARWRFQSVASTTLKSDRAGERMNIRRGEKDWAIISSRGALLYHDRTIRRWQ